MHQELLKIREQLGYNVRDFAELLGFGDKHATYHCYETGRRKAPESVITEARAAFKRDRNFFNKDLPKSIDKHAAKGIRNEARKGDW